MPNANPTVAYPTQIIFYQLTLGACVGLNRLTLGLVFAPQNLLVTNIWVKVTRNCCFWVSRWAHYVLDPQSEAQKQEDLGSGKI